VARIPWEPGNASSHCLETPSGMEISVNNRFGTLEIFAAEFSSPLLELFETGWKLFPAGDPLPDIHPGCPSNRLAGGGSSALYFFRSGVGSVSMPLENFQTPSRVGWKIAVGYTTVSILCQSGVFGVVMLSGVFEPFLACSSWSSFGVSMVWKFVSIPAGKTSSRFRHLIRYRGAK
jgi:hypothetical protein